jgi:hypothetical protein
MIHQRSYPVPSVTIPPQKKLNLVIQVLKQIVSMVQGFEARRATCLPYGVGGF